MDNKNTPLMEGDTSLIVFLMNGCFTYKLTASQENSAGFPQLLENLEKWQVFPVLEKYWNFIILLKILKKWEWTWKNELSRKKLF